MKENVEYYSINDENQNYLNIITNNNNINNTYKKVSPKFSDILSISSNPEEIFTLLYPIGHGGFGKVYKAIHNETKTIYAIKIINFINNSKNKSINNFQNIYFNFNYSLAQKESSLMKLCNQSKYIVNYYGSYYSKKTNTLWLILEYCPAGSIVDLMLSMNRTYSEEEISTIMKNVLKGLILIHSKNLIHRDIKAANIFLSQNGYAKLGDFGVGVQLGINDFFRNSKKGSPYWMSPQVVKNLDYDMKTDIWSLGITCCEMCNGEPPFAELNPQNVMEKIGNNPPKVDEIIKKEEYSEEFYDFVKKCLEVEPNKRPNAKELIKHEFINKYSKDNDFIKELIEKHIEDINNFRKLSNINYNNDHNNDNIENNKENIEENKIIPEVGNIKIIHINHHEKNNPSNITSHFNDDIKINNFKEKENLLIKMISSSSNVDNGGVNSTKDTQNQIKEEKTEKSSKIDYMNFPTFHKIEDENNITSDNDSLEIIEVHNLCKSFDNNYFVKEDKNSDKNINKKNKNKIKLTKKNKTGEKINLFLDINENENQKEINQNNEKIIFKKKIRNKFKGNIFTYKNKIKSRNIINKSSDNLFSKKTKSNNSTNFVYVKSRLMKKEKNNFVFKKPIISHKNNNCVFHKTKDDNNLLLDTNDEEGHINNTNLFNTKSNFDLLKNNNKDNFSKTNYCFYKSLLKLDEINIFKSDINNDSIDNKD